MERADDPAALWLRPPDSLSGPVVLASHGGGFVSASASTHRRTFGHRQVPRACRCSRSRCSPWPSSSASSCAARRATGPGGTIGVVSVRSSVAQRSAGGGAIALAHDRVGRQQSVIPSPPLYRIAGLLVAALALAPPAGGASPQVRSTGAPVTRDLWCHDEPHRAEDELTHGVREPPGQVGPSAALSAGADSPAEDRIPSGMQEEPARVPHPAGTQGQERHMTSEGPPTARPLILLLRLAPEHRPAAPMSGDPCRGQQGGHPHPRDLGRRPRAPRQARGGGGTRRWPAPFFSRLEGVGVSPSFCGAPWAPSLVAARRAKRDSASREGRLPLSRGPGRNPVRTSRVRAKRERCSLGGWPRARRELVQPARLTAFSPGTRPSAKHETRRSGAWVSARAGRSDTARQTDRVPPPCRCGRWSRSRARRR